MRTETCDYLIVGAGVSGLMFANEKKDADFLLIEKITRLVDIVGLFTRMDSFGITQDIFFTLQMIMLSLFSKKELMRVSLFRGLKALRFFIRVIL